jgi:excisionase family DNA binding protein
MQYALEKRLYSLTEAAAIAGVSYSLMRKLVKQEKIRVVRVGKRLMVPEAEIEKLLKELTGERRW